MKKLITNGQILLSDGSSLHIAQGDIVIENEQISEVLVRDGSQTAGRQPEAYDELIDASGKLVMPGLINAHTHAYMTLFRNYADDLQFFEWLDKVQAVEDYLTPQDCYWGTMLAIIEMIRTGTTCFVDMPIRGTVDGCTSGADGSACAAVHDSGIRAYLGRGMVGEADDEASRRRFREFFADRKLFAGHPRVGFVLSPHAPYSCQPGLLRRLRELALDEGMIINTHISESEAEVANMAQSHNGMTPVQYLAETGLFDAPVLAAHCVNVTEEDIAFLKDRNFTVALNPRSNMKLGNGFAPAEALMNAGINLCIGTDGCGSNNTQNMFQEMNAVGLVYKGREKKAKCIDAQDVIRFATEGAAKALGMEGRLGVIRPGALADLIMIDLEQPQFVPQNNIISGLVYSANGSEVDSVMVHGRMLMKNRKIEGIDCIEVYRQCEEITKRLGMH